MQEIIEKYIYAVIKHLDVKKRDSVKKELNNSIHDSLNKRTAGRKAQEADVYAVLEEIGKPSDVAEKYMNSRKTSLIRGVYFRNYKRVLLFVLPLVAIICAICTYTLSIVNKDDWLKCVTSCSKSVIFGIVFYFCVITLIFVVLQKWNIKFDGENVRLLPSVPDEANKHSNFKSYLTILFMFVMGLITYINPSMLFYATENGKKVGIFDEGVFHQLDYLIIVILVIVLIRECSVIVSKRMSVKLYIWLLLLDIIEIGLFFALFLRSGIINSQFSRIFENMFSDKEIIVNLFLNVNYWIVGGLLVIVLLDNISDLRRIGK